MFWAMLLKPLVALVLYGTALWLAQMVMRVIPDGWLRRLLVLRVGRRGTARRWRHPRQ